MEVYSIEATFVQRRWTLDIKYWKTNFKREIDKEFGGYPAVEEAQNALKVKEPRILPRMHKSLYSFIKPLRIKEFYLAWSMCDD